MDGPDSMDAAGDAGALIARAVAGDTAAADAVDLAVDAAVARRDFAVVDAHLRPLAEAAAAGSERALGLLLGLLDDHGLVRGTVAKHLRDPDLIDDACQDALFSVARNIDSYEGRARVTSWVYPIAANAARMITRSRARRPEELHADLPAVPASMRRMSSILVDRARIVEAFATLEDHYRAPLELRELEGLSYQEIAERLDLSVGTVKSRISRAREHLARLLGPPAP